MTGAMATVTTSLVEISDRAEPVKIVLTEFATGEWWGVVIGESTRRKRRQVTVTLLDGPRRRWSASASASCSAGRERFEGRSAFAPGPIDAP